MMPNGSMDLVCLQEGFSSLIKNADPQHLGAFFVWLDLKVAQFKISGKYSPDKNKAPLEKVTKNLFDSENNTPATSNGSSFQNASNSEIQNFSTAYLTTPTRDNRSYFDHLKKPISFSESKLSLYQLNWEAFDPRAGFRNNLDIFSGFQRALFPHLLHEAPNEPLDFSKSDKKPHLTAFNAGTSSAATESVQSSGVKPSTKEGVRSLLREVLSRPREIPVCSTPIKTSPSIKEEKIFPPADVVVVMPEEPPPTESHEEEKHICTYCSKTFNYKSSYRRHMKIHQGIFSHVCYVCNRKFTRKEHFVRHKCNRRPNKPNRKSGILDISMNSEPDSSSLVRMDEDSPLKIYPSANLRASPVGPGRADSSVGCGPTTTAAEDNGDTGSRNFIAELKTEEHQTFGNKATNSPHDSHDDDFNKNNLESRRKSSTPRKFVPKFSAKEGGASDCEEKTRSTVMKQENDSMKAQLGNTAFLLPALQQSLDIVGSNHHQMALFSPVKARGEQHLDLQTGSYVVSTSRTADRDETLAIKIKKQAKYLKLKNEAKMVDGTLRFECPQCSKVFYRSSNFSRHMRIHRGVFSYVCQACRRGFFRKEHFQKHKCHRRGQDVRLGTTNSPNLMPSTIDSRNLPQFGGINRDHEQQVLDNIVRPSYLPCRSTEDVSNLVRCIQ